MLLFAALLAASFVMAGLTSGILTWVVREVATSRNWATPPRSNRHIHTIAIPRLGGVAIFGAFFSVGLIALGLVRSFSKAQSDLEIRNIVGIAVPATFLFVVGLADDIRPLSARLKLVFQIVSAACLYGSGIRALDLAMPIHGFNFGPIVSFASTIVWVIGISNAVNIIDGIDGLAAGSALFSIATVFIMALTASNYIVALASIILAGSLLGFLRFNFNPATIFLGDCGSLFIGFLLSSLALAGRHTSAPVAVAVAVPVVALGLPITETAVSIARRLLRGTGVFVPDRRHFHHRLLDMGLTQRQAVSLLYAFSAICALASIFLIYPDPLTTGLSLIMVGGIAVFGIQKLGYAEFSEFGRIARRTLEQRRVITNNVHLRCAAEEISRSESLEDVYTILRETVDRAGLLGFDLFVNPPEHAISVGGEPQYSPSELKWWRSDSTEVDGPRWTLSIQLISDLEDVGLLSIHGPVGERQMLFDANVLIADLQPALSGALRRHALRAVASRSVAKTEKTSLKARQKTYSRPN